MATSLLASFLLLWLLGTLHTASAQGNVDRFIGRWALYLPGGAGWLEVRQEEGFLDADILWYGGSVVPVSDVYVHQEKLIVTRTAQAEFQLAGGKKRTQTVTTRIELEGSGDDLIGKMIAPKKDGASADITVFMAKRIPPLPPAPNLSKVNYGNPVRLFNGKNLEGWQLVNPETTNGWKVEDGILVNDPVQPENGEHLHYGNLRTVQEFEDFNLQAEVNVPAGSNSGIYLRGLYEVQVADSYGKKPDSHNMGAIYSRRAPEIAAEKPAGEWQKLDITLVRRHATVYLNGKKIIDNAPLYGPTGGALTADEFSPGPIYLQGDHGRVMYRNIVLTPVVKE
jgi:hypothetical protein